MQKNRGFETGNGGEAAAQSASARSVVRTAVGIVWFLAVVNILLSVLALVFQIEVLRNLGADVFTLGLGVFYAVMALLVQMKRSVLALVLATALFVFDSVSIVFFQVLDGADVPIGATVTRVFFLYYLVKAVPVLRRMRSQKPEPVSPPVPSLAGGNLRR